MTHSPPTTGSRTQCRSCATSTRRSCTNAQTMVSVPALSQTRRLSPRWSEKPRRRPTHSTYPKCWASASSAMKRSSAKTWRLASVGCHRPARPPAADSSAASMSNSQKWNGASYLAANVITAGDRRNSSGATLAAGENVDVRATMQNVWNKHCSGTHAFN